MDQVDVSIHAYQSQSINFSSLITHIVWTTPFSSIHIWPRLILSPCGLKLLQKNVYQVCDFCLMNVKFQLTLCILWFYGFNSCIIYNFFGLDVHYDFFFFGAPAKEAWTQERAHTHGKTTHSSGKGARRRHILLSDLLAPARHAMICRACLARWIIVGMLCLVGLLGFSSDLPGLLGHCLL
jgi:hypothetical protein